MKKLTDGISLDEQARQLQETPEYDRELTCNVFEDNLKAAKALGKLPKTRTSNT